jgi:ketosteroid isomerase-like protein
MMQSFNAFLAERQAAGLQYLQGDGQPVVTLSAASDPSTFFAPNGDLIEGFEAINREKLSGARRFGPNSTSEWLCKDMGCSGELGFWIGYQNIAADVDGTIHASSVRVTEIYRIIDGAWKIIHRHAS